MYLKSLEVHGFKSFANKIVFDFHNGITGIVGPNGSGKSNVADAVRWVLGEQSARQLRGASMQDVIFAGTENRKPLSYAYVAITLDNSDHQLAIDYEEVTIARRVYRSGESEYLINGSPCRLKDVSELFYDTGIGKEGYSIIGQGQIDKILSGRPEEKRELFDEAAGIVKFKKRKVTAQRKLEEERENLVRVNDILSELERQVGPLEKQSAKAKDYLKYKENLKKYEVNKFLMENKRLETEKNDVEEKFKIADSQKNEVSKNYQNIKNEYEKLEQDIEKIDSIINETKENINNSSLNKNRLEGQINVLKEQIKAAENTDEHFKNRLNSIEEDKLEKEKSKREYLRKQEEIEANKLEISSEREKIETQVNDLKKENHSKRALLDESQANIIHNIKDKTLLEGKKQQQKTLIEQINIRKAQLNQRLLARKSEEEDIDSNVKEFEKVVEDVNARIDEVKKKQQEAEHNVASWKNKLKENSKQIEENNEKYHKVSSKLETLKNIAERYEGFGNSVKRVMEQKTQNPKICGVVSDLIKAEKKYEIAIETALGGNVQNIVTEDETTAKEMIEFLKKNRYGRATFLPVTSVTGRKNPKSEEALECQGAIGMANELVDCDSKFNEICAYLLGRVIVVDNIDNALAIAKKFKYSLHMVTLDGEYLSPGGTLAGGAFKNASNLLSRKREIEDLEKELEKAIEMKEKLKSRRGDIDTARILNEDENNSLRKQLQELRLEKNTADLNLKRVQEQKGKSDDIYQTLRKENEEIEKQLLDINNQTKEIDEQLENAQNETTRLEKLSLELKVQIDDDLKKEDAAAEKLADIKLKEANIIQEVNYIKENIERLNEEISKFDKEKAELIANASMAKEEIEAKKNSIEEIQKTIANSSDAYSKWQETLQENIKKKEELSAIHKGFFEKQEEVTNKLSLLDKEIFRLNSQKEKLVEEHDRRTNYMWNEYELTPHAALELESEEFTNEDQLRKMIHDTKEDIKKLGDVNVNAIEEYKEVSTRYEFLKTQHDDLIKAEESLVGIIADLDEGMRKQFTEKFSEIQTTFNETFKKLFGGGKGSLELAEGEDILECGIKIIAQPPGKKLQNMMQLSGGEKALTAIALLFAIQALKPSPFCLLDEIEAALDDSNVSKYANYLSNLTNHTQFIVITHRRGTMNAADRLYGITMQEKGVSTLVSVDLIEKDLSE
ncbi:chromosome segregation protein SMC [Lachnobacterium bovis]|uniref:chromosome segregation protein SMC n=1 Tax=Lachnobacterium bovis TaxID=140626 RepID=UPI00048049D3|nr:chromosome segregation protein SMC [Lachnobacterium bovis]